MLYIYTDPHVGFVTAVSSSVRETVKRVDTYTYTHTTGGAVIEFSSRDTYHVTTQNKNNEDADK